MRRTGVGTLVWIIYVCWVQTTLGTDCDTLISGSALDVQAGTTCTVSAALPAQGVTVTVYGTISITTPNAVLEVDELEIKAGGVITADAVSDAGPGEGNSLGSGGTIYMMFAFSVCHCPLFFTASMSPLSKLKCEISSFEGFIISVTSIINYFNNITRSVFIYLLFT